MFKKTISTISALVFIFVLSAQEKWDLRKCVDYALENNITIKQQDIQAQVAELTYKQSDLSRYPNLNLSTNLGLNTGRSIDRTTNLYTTQSIFNNYFSLQSNVRLFNWFSLKNTVDANKLESLAARATVDKVKDDIALNIAAAYLQALLSKEQVRASQVIVEQTRSQLDVTKKRVEAGSLPQLNQLQLESQLAADSLTLISAIGTETQSLLFIKSLLNLEADAAFDIATPPIDLIPVDPIAELQPELVYQLAIKNLPQQKSNDYRLEAAKKYASAAKGAMYPTISAGLNLGTSYSNIKSNPAIASSSSDIVKVGNVFGTNAPVIDTVTNYRYNFYSNSYTTQLSDNFSNGVGIGISIPIFNGNSAKINWQKQKLNLRSMELQRDLDNLNLKQNIYNAYADAMTALQKYSASTKAVESAQKTYEFSQKRYEAELLNTLDLIISQSNLFRANIDKLSAQYDYVFKMKVLEFYKGQGIKL